MQDKAVIFLFSGNMDKAHKSLLLAKSFAEAGMDVTVFFACWGLNVVKKDKGRLRGGKGFVQKMMGMMNRGGVSRLPLSRFNWLGMGRKMMTGMMSQHGVPPTGEMLDIVHKAGVRLWACSMTMDVTGVDKDDLIPTIKKVVCLNEYAAAAREAKVNLFVS